MVFDYVFKLVLKKAAATMEKEKKQKKKINERKVKHRRKCIKKSIFHAEKHESKFEAYFFI